jgi:hypothetical protein
MDGLCVEPSPEALRIFLEVEPLADVERTLPQRWRFDPEVVLGPGTQDLALPQGVEVVGQIRFDGVTVPADIGFARVQTVPMGVQDELRTRTYVEPSNVSIGGTRLEADFASALGGGGIYDVTITPTTAPFDSGDGELPPPPANRVVPPTVLRGVVLPSDVPRWALQVDLGDFSRPCSADLRAGCTLSGDVVRVSDTGAEAPETGLQVRAVERLSGRVVSSVDITDDGHFAIAVAEDAGPYALRISAGSERPLFPGVTADVVVGAASAPRIVVPSFETVSYAGTVETTEGVPLPDAQVLFSAVSILNPDSGLEATWQQTTVTESGRAAGEFEISLVPGIYDVIVTPSAVTTTDPRDEPGILAQRVVLAEGLPQVRGQVFIVPRRASFGAQVWAPSGEALPLSVEAIPLRREGLQGIVTRYNRSAAAVAGPSGAFDLRLDLGVYDIVAQPPAAGGFPWVVFPDVSIAIPGSTSARTLDIGMPVPRSGVVRASDGTPLAGARVTAYVLIDAPEGERALRVATTTSDVDGHYRLLLPSRLEPAR